MATIGVSRPGKPTGRGSGVVRQIAARDASLSTDHTLTLPPLGSRLIRVPRCYDMHYIRGALRLQQAAF